MSRAADLQERLRLARQLLGQLEARLRELEVPPDPYRRGPGRLHAPGWGPQLCRVELVRAEVRSLEEQLEALGAPCG